MSVLELDTLNAHQYFSIDCPTLNPKIYNLWRFQSIVWGNLITTTLIYLVSEGEKLVHVEKCSNVHYTLISTHTNLKYITNRVTLVNY